MAKKPTSKPDLRLVTIRYLGDAYSYVDGEFYAFLAKDETVRACLQGHWAELVRIGQAEVLPE